MSVDVRVSIWNILTAEVTIGRRLRRLIPARSKHRYSEQADVCSAGDVDLTFDPKSRDLDGLPFDFSAVRLLNGNLVLRRSSARRESAQNQIGSRRKSYRLWPRGRSYAGSLASSISAEMRLPTCCATIAPEGCNMTEDPTPPENTKRL